MSTPPSAADIITASVLQHLRDNLRIEMDFAGWDYGWRANCLTAKIKLGDEVISESYVTIEPVEND